VAHEQAAVGALPGDAERAGHAAAASVAGAVVADEAIAVGEDRLVHQRLEEVRADAGVDEHDRLASAAVLVGELDALERGAFLELLHRVPPRPPGR
jgi:hypothetical protein